MTETVTTPSSFCGFVAILGAANAGKSTLTNALTGEKVSIISTKPNTTRNRIYGIVTEGKRQLILVDTPGLLLQPEGMLQRYMSKTVWQSSRQADVSIVLVDSKRPRHAVTTRLLKELTEKERRVFLVFNKVDGMQKELLLPLSQRYSMFTSIERFFMISGRTGSGLNDLRQALFGCLPEGPWLFPEDALTQISQNVMAAEVTREKLFECLHQEVPYGVHVSPDLWYVPGESAPPPPHLKLPKTGISIMQTILVAKEGYKKLILGHEGSRIRHIGKKAREELTERLGTPVHLFLYVKVAPKWRDDPSTYRFLEG